ncbi:hypothetical protein CERSUDRAFT_83332 [Gelatoporia subvermispora B]|uniref:Uncharacterized protein n=1 Tax=Ceriporiopsis subvermispora (strain B) TaxID=914234 RepID=M2PMH0_CERS8|nr:hypothetical protein CERSUDRAFT_83332 [Gelatoporia subvermispora B]
MAVKRKFDHDHDDAPASMTKQPRLVPFPQSQSDADIDMMDTEVPEMKPLIIPPQPFHTRLPSNASFASSSTLDSPDGSPSYPTFDLYPYERQDYMDLVPTSATDDKCIGLMQPRGSGFTHHG